MGRRQGARRSHGRHQRPRQRLPCSHRQHCRFGTSTDGAGIGVANVEVRIQKGGPAVLERLGVGRLGETWLPATKGDATDGWDTWEKRVDCPSTRLGRRSRYLGAGDRRARAEEHHVRVGQLRREQPDRRDQDHAHQDLADDRVRWDRDSRASSRPAAAPLSGSDRLPSSAATSRADGCERQLLHLRQADGQDHVHPELRG